MKYINDVEDVFDIVGRGCVIVPGIPNEFEPTVLRGSTLEFRNPDGSIVTSKINGFEMINMGKKLDHAPYSLERPVTKNDVQVGAKVYLVL